MIIMIIMKTSNPMEIDVFKKRKNGDSDMLETSEERAKLLKAGISARRIEQLYIINNNKAYKNWMKSKNFHYI